MSFGVMGGHMQPQGIRIGAGVILHCRYPQAARDAPRSHITERSRVALEPGFPPELAKHLTERGHRLVDAPDATLFGGARAIETVGEGHRAGQIAKYSVRRSVPDGWAWSLPDGVALLLRFRHSRCLHNPSTNLLAELESTPRSGVISAKPNARD